MAEAIPFTSADIPYYKDSSILILGPKNRSAIKRLAILCTNIVKHKIPIPDSEFVKWAAERVTNDNDKQDLIIFIQGRRGSGKSHSALYLAYRCACMLAKVKGGKWQDYFSMETCATLEDTDSILKILNEAGENKIVVIDDCSLALSNRSWNTPQNRNFNALISICRTNRWILILTAPLKKHVDNQVREMLDLTASVEHSFHAGGFNVLKVTSSEISSYKNKEYTSRMTFMDKKIDYWVAFKAPKELTEPYDKKRNATAREINTRIVETGSFQKSGKRLSKREQREAEDAKLYDEYGTEVIDLYNKNYKNADICRKLKLNRYQVDKILQRGDANE